MADDNVMTMVARLKYETPAEFKQMQQQFQNAARSPGVRELHQRFQGLRDVLTPLTGVLKDSLMPMLNTVGITSLSLVGVMTGLAAGMQKFAAGAIDMKDFADQVRLSTDQVHAIIDAAELANVSNEEMLASLQKLSVTFLEMTAGPDQTVTGASGLAVLRQMKSFGDRALDHFNKIQAHLRAFPGDTAGAYRLIFEAMDKMQLPPDKRALYLQGWGLSTKLADEHLKKVDEAGHHVHLNLEMAKDFNKEWFAFGREIDNIGKTIANEIGPTLTKIIAGMREFMADWEKSPPPWWFSQFMSLALNETTGAIAGQIARTPLVTNQSWGDWLMRGPQNTLQPRGSGSMFEGGTGAGAGTFQDQRTREGGQLPSDRFRGAAPSGPGAPAPTAPGAAPPTPFSQRFGGWEGGGTMRAPSTGEIVPGTRPAPIAPGQQGAVAPGQQGAVPGQRQGAAQGGAIDRSQFAAEVSDPAVVARLASMVKGEIGLSASREQQMIQTESAFNRSQIRGHSLTHGLKSVDERGGYYARDTYRRAATPEEIERYKRDVLAPVMAGSDVGTQKFGFTPTGNASTQWAVKRAGQGGKYYAGSGWYSGVPGKGEMYALEAADAKKLANLKRTGGTANPAATVDTGPAGTGRPVGTMTERMAPAGTRPLSAGLTKITTESGKSFTVSKQYAENFRGFLNDYERAGGVIGPDSGGLGSRPGNASYHPLGQAFDLNQVGYGIRSKRGITLSQQQEDALAAKWGLFPGSQFKSRSDIGHFEVRNREAAQRALAIQQQQTASPGLDRALQGQTGVREPKGAADLNIDVKAPRGTTVEAEPRGVFNETKINRSMKGDREEAKPAAEEKEKEDVE